MRAGRELDCAFVSKASFLSNSRSRVLPTDSMMPMDETECSETSSLEAGSVQSLQRVFQPAMDKLCNISNVLMLCLCNFSTMLCIYPLTCPLTPLFRGNALWPSRQDTDTTAGDRCEAILRVWRQCVPDRT